MGYIIKSNQGFVITKLTDVGRRKISQGNFNISYFQVGDSEVDYNAYENLDVTTAMVIEPSSNSQNNTGIPYSTKNAVKYPYFLQGKSGTTYGSPFENSSIEGVYNTAAPIGFFTPDKTCASTTPQMILNQSIDYMKKANILSDSMKDEFIGNASPSFSTASSNCSNFANTIFNSSDLIVIYYNNQSQSSTIHCECMPSCRPILFYKLGSNSISNPNLDRNTLNLESFTTATGRARAFVLPKNFSYYDVPSPINAWASSTSNFGSICSPEDEIVKIWNMNIVWSENPAGSIPSTNFNYYNFPSAKYLGTKEYLGYSSTGQTDTSNTFYYNSYGDKIIVEPQDQKAIAIVHYSNNMSINYYGEKFADEPYDPTSPGDTGQARNFKISLPWLMWHKNTNCCGGGVFYIDPPGFDSFNLLKPYYIQSTKNKDMNNPGIRYYHLYDTNEAYPDGPPNRVGKVFPDDKLVIFDDEEIIAAMSYVANRNYTLPAPRLSTVNSANSSSGLLATDEDILYVTYLFDSNGVWDGMHCNYYPSILGPTSGCNASQQDVVVSFGGNFNCMSQPTTSFVGGWYSKNFYILCQKKSKGQRPIDNEWKIIDFTSQLNNAGHINAQGFIAPSGMTQETFIITSTLYNAASTYNINNYLTVTTQTSSGKIQFGEEYFFFGTIETDIEATIYEMKYNINLTNNQFVKSSNPTWSEGKQTLMTEIGLYDNENDLLVYSKFQSPQIRLGTQQAVVKLDF